MKPFSNKDVIVTWDLSSDGRNPVVSIKIDFDKGKGQLELLVDKRFLKKAILIGKELSLDEEISILDEIF